MPNVRFQSWLFRGEALLGTARSHSDDRDDSRPNLRMVQKDRGDIRLGPRARRTRGRTRRVAARAREAGISRPRSAAVAAPKYTGSLVGPNWLVRSHAIG